MRVKRLLTLAAALTIVLALPVSATTLDFDTDNEGFVEQRIIRDPFDPPTNETLSTPPAAAEWVATGGVGNTGYIRQEVNNNRDNRAFTMYFDQSPNLLGDLTGQTLTAAIKQFGTGLTPEFLGFLGPEVRLRWTIAKYDGFGNETRYFSKESESIAMNDPVLQNWTTRTIALQETNFLLWPNNQAAPLLSFADLLQDYDAIGFMLTSDTDDLDNYNTSVNAYTDVFDVNRLGHYGANADCDDGAWGLDNFGVVVPEPATMTLLGLGIAGMAFQGIRSRKTAKA
jgi:hypothetical protein